MAVSANRLELLQIADAVAREKVIDRQIVLAAMEDAIQKAARSRYGQETEVRAEINPKTGEIRFSRLLPDKQFESLPFELNEKDMALLEIQSIREKQQLRDFNNRQQEDRGRNYPIDNKEARQ